MTSKEAAEILQHDGMGEANWHAPTTERPAKSHNEFLAAEILFATLPEIQERMKQRLEMVKNNRGKIHPQGLSYEAALMLSDLAAIYGLSAHCLRMAERVDAV